jgi:hypothetical protein
MEEESIYNLIPKEYVPPPKPKKYKSKFPHTTPPTASTFGLHTTSKVVGNISGDYSHFNGAHAHTNASAHFGKPKGTIKKDPSEFTKKNSGTLINAAQQTFKIDRSDRKPAVPKVAEKPIMGLKSEKNFIVSNAVNAILSAPKAAPEEMKYVTKKDYGKTPDYLNRVKQDIEQEYETLRQLKDEEERERDQQRFIMSVEEVKELKEGLRKKWEAVNKEYQTVTHISKIDTQGLKRKKETCEKELAQLERDMAMLDKAYVFVDAKA